MAFNVVLTLGNHVLDLTNDVCYHTAMAQIRTVLDSSWFERHGCGTNRLTSSRVWHLIVTPGRALRYWR